MNRALGLHERMFLAVWNRFFAVAFGWRQDAFNESIVRNTGIGGLMRFGKTISEVVGRLADRYGEPTAQLIVGFAGLWNGCRFCGIGHNLTANILFHRDEDVLFPIDETEIMGLQKRTDDEIMQFVKDRLAGTRFETQLRILERMDALRRGTPTGETDDDLFLSAALEMWLWANECSIEFGLDLPEDQVPIFGRLTRRSAAYRRYREARGPDSRLDSGG